MIDVYLRSKEYLLYTKYALLIWNGKASKQAKKRDLKVCLGLGLPRLMDKVCYLSDLKN